MKWERTFLLSAPAAEVWRAFMDPEAEFRVLDPDNAYQSRGAVKVEYTEVDENRFLAWTETSGDDVWKMSVTFEEAETKTRITVVRSGFGDSDDWTQVATGRLLGWEDILADLEIYYRTGRKLDRLYNRRWGRLGLNAIAADGGLRVIGTRPNTPAGTAGLEHGDVIVRMGGAPTVHMSDLWLLESVLPDATETDVEFFRGTDLRTTRLTLPRKAPERLSDRAP